MKHRVISTSDVPMSIPFVTGAVLLKKRGDSTEVEISEALAQILSEPGAVRFERIEDPAPEPVVKPVEPKTAVRAKPVAVEPSATDPAQKSE